MPNDTIKPVATLVDGFPRCEAPFIKWSAFGTPEIGTELYTLPATHRIVPVELLRHLTGHGDKIQTLEAFAEAKDIIDKEPT